MDDKAFQELDSFLKLHEGEFISFPLTQSDRKESLQDKLLRAAYFSKRKMKK
jgi:hypothetical protein